MRAKDRNGDLMKTNRIALELFLTFGKVGIFTFGGGYAMIPLIQKEIVETKKWISNDDILEILAIAESTPGPIAINAATFTGYRVSGIFGAFCATMGVVLPSFFIILGLSYVMREFQELEPVQYAFMGIRAAVLALVIKALWSMYNQCPKGLVTYLIMAAVLIAAAVFSISIFPIMIGCAFLGCLSTAYTRRIKNEKEETML